MGRGTIVAGLKAESHVANKAGKKKSSNLADESADPWRWAHIWMINGQLVVSLHSRWAQSIGKIDLITVRRRGHYELGVFL